MNRILMILALGGLMAVGANAQDAGGGTDTAPEKAPETAPEEPAETKPEPDSKEAKKAERKKAKKGRKNKTNPREYREIGAIVRALDTDLDRKVSKEEFADDEAFTELDGDEDGFLTARELLANVKLVKRTMKKRAEEIAREEFTILDRDDSGELTEAELGKDFAGYMAGDADDDKQLTLEEFLSGRENVEAAKREQRRKKAMDPARMMKALDKDGDGKISKDEAQRQLKKNFDKADANGDGFINLEELTSALKQANGQRGKRGKQDKKSRKKEQPKKEAKPKPKPAPKDGPNSAEEEEF